MDIETFFQMVFTSFGISLYSGLSKRKNQNPHLRIIIPVQRIQNPEYFMIQTVTETIIPSKIKSGACKIL